MNPARLIAPWVHCHALGRRWKGHSETLKASEKLCLLPPRPAQGFTFWLRHNSLPCTQSDPPQVPRPQGCASSLCWCRGKAGVAMLPGWLPCQPWSSRWCHRMPRTTDRSLYTLQCAVHHRADSEPCYVRMRSPWPVLFIFRSIFYKIKHLNNVSAAWLFPQGCVSVFLCCRISLDDFHQTALHGCGVSESAKRRPDADVPLKTFVYLVCQKDNGIQAEPEF